jgi:sensor histidine kinase regulating citrate/malate metabolism
VGNLTKNALEESGVNDEIILTAGPVPGGLYFNIFNEKVILPNVQLQLFQRSFSTKQKKGRGLGLYSVKLIVEHYLNGKVSFVSNEKERTNFTIHLPSDPSRSFSDDKI